MKLKNKTAIITGAGAGIGAASAVLFAKEGAHVVAVDVDAASLENLSQHIEARQFLGMKADVSRRDDVLRVVQSALEKFGRIDILFNNAGIVPPGKIDEIAEDQWDRAMAVNLKSMYLFSHAIVPLFKQQGGGVILNTASAAALRVVVDRACYTATKAAVVGLTKSMALDYVKHNIRVNCLCPGTIDTPSLGQRLAALPNPEEARKNFIARQPMGRFGTANEIASAALYLVSDEGSFITGIAFPVDGGFSL